MYTPERQLRRRRLRRRLKFYGFLLIFGWFLIAVAAFLFYFPIFKLQKISIDGGDAPEVVLAAARPQMLQSFWQRLLGLNHWLVWRETTLTPTNPLLAQIAIDKNLWRREVTLKVKEKTPYAILCNEICEVIDTDGNPLGKKETGLELAIIRGKPEKNSWPILKKIIETTGSREYQVNSELQEVRTKPADHPQLLFSLRFDPQINLAALDKIKQRPDFVNLEYIDLRVENRIYYR